MTDPELETRQRRAAQNQSFFRDVNEGLKDMNSAVGTVRGAEFVCECAGLRCVERITLTLDEYEAVRRIPTRFVVKPGSTHFYPEAERIVDSLPGCLVVEKFGQAGIDAVALDPRATGAVLDGR